MDALRALVFGIDVPATLVESREALYQNIYEVKDSSAFQNLRVQGLSIVELTAQTSMAVAAMAGDTAMQFALETLSPFVVSGATLPSLPARSREYWAAREMLLQRKLWFSENDIDPATPAAPTGPEGGLPLHQFQAENTYFQDIGAGYTISQGAALNSTTRYIFAADEGSTVSGAGVADSLFGGAGEDLLFGNYGFDLLEGYEGDDVLDGGQGADTLRGGDGNDWLGYVAANEDSVSTEEVNSEGNDYTGGRGDDRIAGSINKDFYRYTKGDGRDVVRTHGGGDELILENILLEEAGFTRIGNDLVIELPQGGAVTLRGWFDTYNPQRLAVARFSDATLTEEEMTSRVGIVLTEGNYSFTGTSGADVIYGLGGNDSIQGDGVGPGNDRIYGGAGNDTIYGLGGDDRLHGDSGNDALYGGDGNDLLEGGDGDDVLDGGRGYDVLVGGAGDDTLGGSGDIGSQHSIPGAGNEYRGGTGNDALNGTGYSDLYHFDRGDGHDSLTEREPLASWGAATDVLRFGQGISPDDVTVGRIGNDLVLRVDAGADSVTVKSWFTSQSSTANQVERVEFADGTLWLAAEVTSRALDMTGTAGNDNLTGHAYYTNILRGADGNDSLTGGNLVDELYGGEGNDTLNGGSGDDLLRGDVGNDALNGGGGNDTYRYFAGDGYDTLVDTSGSADVLDFADLDFSTASFFRVGNDLEVSFGSGQGVLVKNQFSTTSPVVEFLLFAGQQYTAAQVGALAGPKA